MKEVIIAVKEKLANLPSLRYVDEDWGQLDAYSPNFPVQWPCALIDLADNQFSNTGRVLGSTPENRQENIFKMIVRVANLRLGNSSAKAPLPQKTLAYSVWDEIAKVHAALHGWRPTDNGGQLIRESITRAVRDDGVQEYIIVFSGHLNDI
jgi:hypothetical protein